MTRDEWIEAYRLSWLGEKKYDAELFEQMFADDVEFRPEVLNCIEPPAVGRDAVLAYYDKWKKAVHWDTFEIGARFESGNLLAFEFWATGEEGGKGLTEAGCPVLVFDEQDRCVQFRDYHVLGREVEPPLDGFGPASA